MCIYSTPVQYFLVCEGICHGLLLSPVRLPAVVAAVLDVRFLAPEDADGGGGARAEGEESTVRPVFHHGVLLLPALTSGDLFLCYFLSTEGVGKQGGGGVGVVVGVDEDVLSQF